MKMKIVSSLMLALLLSASVRAESPCVECLKAAQNNLAICLNNAKSEADKSACNKALQDAVAACNAGVCKK